MRNVLKAQCGSIPATQPYDCEKPNCAPEEREIPALLSVLSDRIERLSTLQADLRFRLESILCGVNLPKETGSKAPNAQTGMGSILANEIARVDCMVQDLIATLAAVQL